MRPGLRMPAGSKAALSRRCRPRATASSGAKTPCRASPGSEQGCVAPGLCSDFAGVPAANPAQAAAPLDQGIARQPERRTIRRHGEAPQRLGAAKKRVPVLAHVAPELAVREPRAAEPLGRGAHRGLRAGEAHAQDAAVPGRGRDRQRLAGPAIHGLERGRLAQLELQAELARGHRQDLERRFGDQAQRPEGAGGEAREVVAGDVLHHLAAEAERAGRGRPPASRRGRSRAARRPRRGAARRGRRRRSRPASPRPKCGGSKGRHWPFSSSISSISGSGVPQRAVITSSVGS